MDEGLVRLLLWQKIPPAGSEDARFLQNIALMRLNIPGIIDNLCVCTPEASFCTHRLLPARISPCWYADGL